MLAEDVIEDIIFVRLSCVEVAGVCDEPVETSANLCPDFMASSTNDSTPSILDL
jgi:hypothetical protein